MRFSAFEQSTSAIHALQNGVLSLYVKNVTATAALLKPQIDLAIKAAHERENAIRRALKFRRLDK